MALAGINYALCVAVDLTINGIDVLVELTAIFLAVGMMWHSAALLAGSGGSLSARTADRLGRIAEAIGAFGIWIGFAACVVVLSYACARIGQPLHDESLVAIDRSLGFDWTGWHQFVTVRVWPAQLLDAAYGTLKMQLIAILVMSAFSDDRNRMAEFRWLAMITAIIACVISGLMPVVGARPFHHVAGADWIADLLALRNAGPLQFEVFKMHGIVSLPSYHTALGVIFMWCSRGTGIFGWALIGLNIVMIVSTLTTGGHYLIDVIAGVALALGTIAAINYRSGRRAQTAAAQA
jgi:membrane-associated phospholipid phosphatase